MFLKRHRSKRSGKHRRSAHCQRDTQNARVSLAARKTLAYTPRRRCLLQRFDVVVFAFWAFSAACRATTLVTQRRKLFGQRGAAATPQSCTSRPMPSGPVVVSPSPPPYSTRFEFFFYSYISPHVRKSLSTGSDQGYSPERCW